ncbi:MAG: nucleoside deaminase [Legionellaceae bacterium]|nr:nucleoside deaminase [Legionellaceae bacterium]
MFNPFFMEEAIKEAQKGLASSGIPIGSVLVHKNKIIGRGHNQRIQKKSVTLHAEMDALEDAGRLPAHIYQACTLYTTLSPCSMCAGAILLYQIPHVMIGENKNFMGDETLLASRGVALQVLQDKTCIDLMANFIHANPTLWHEDISI